MADEKTWSRADILACGDTMAEFAVESITSLAYALYLVRVRQRELGQLGAPGHDREVDMAASAMAQLKEAMIHEVEEVVMYVVKEVAGDRIARRDEEDGSP